MNTQNASELERAMEALMRSSSAVVAMDLQNAQALYLCAEISQAFKQVSEGLSIAQKLQMRYLFVGVNSGIGRVICMPLKDMERADQALLALHEQMIGKGGQPLKGTSWVVVPEVWKEALMAQVQKTWGHASMH